MPNKTPCVHLVERAPTDLDQASPLQAIDALHQAATKFRESSAELDAAWQTDGAGEPWRIIARELDRAGARAAIALNKLEPRVWPKPSAADRAAAAIDRAR